MNNFPAPAAIPSGNSGIAAEYPGDGVNSSGQSIRADKRIVLFDDFSDYDTQSGYITKDPAAPDRISNGGLAGRWNYYNASPYIDASNADTFDTSKPITGEKCLRMTLPKGDGERSGEIWQWLHADAAAGINRPHQVQSGGDITDTIKGVRVSKTGYDKLHIRLYMKFAENYDRFGSNHNGPCMNGSYYYRSSGARSTVGTQSDGYKHFLASPEFRRRERETPPPGELAIYYYGATQSGRYGDHFYPTGFRNGFNGEVKFDSGPYFKSRPNFIPKLGEWFCLEFMAKLNTVIEEPDFTITREGDVSSTTVRREGKFVNDGRFTVWINGEVALDYPNLVTRYTNELTIDRVGIYIHAGNNPSETYTWYDNIAVATDYVGPVAE